ncbi:MAG TPA: GIY-YIG nuclease family protein [Candidatus Paceibacterota bacterium]
MERSHPSLKKLPDVPGVYLFKKGRTVLYVGKATSLRDRVRSYFDDDLIATRGPRIVDMVTKADRVAFETTPTVLEALVREAALIKKYQPRANVEGKDDKTFLYAVITKEEWPRVLAVRGKDLNENHTAFVQGSTLLQGRTLYNVDVAKVFGPFPSGPQLREALRLIRRIFPFFDTPKPVEESGAHHRARIEFNRQIGQYPREMDQAAYRHSIRNVALFLDGRAQELRKKLTREMMRAAKEERFEEAAEMKRELFALDHVQDVSLIKEEREESRAGKAGARIEAYDTAHLSGTNAIAVMTVVEHGAPNKKEYRTFRIRGAGNDDIASLREVLSRRLPHTEWSLPAAIVVDGGRTHKKAAEAVLAEAGVGILVIAVVKDEKHRPREIIGARRAGINEADAVLANAEAHRFAIARHRAARRLAK